MNQRTTADMETILYQLLTGSALDTAATGVVSKYSRVAGSVLEDIVINTLPINTGSLQRGTANVNIYVADLNVGTGKVANTKRIGQLARLAVDVLYEGYGADYNYWLTSQSVIQEVESNSHYLNLRVDFKFHNH